MLINLTMVSKRRALILLIFIILSLSGYALLYSWGVVHYLRGALQPRNLDRTLKTEDLRWPQKNADRGEALVLHGLNLEAERMSPIGRIFFDEGFEVFIPRLAGHRGDVDETQINPSGLWREQIANWNASLKKPLICVGYSMGGLLVVERFLSGHLNCTKFVLFAPAFATHLPTVLSTWLDLLIPYNLIVPSAIPPDYRHFDRMGLGPTLAVPKIIAGLRDLLPERNERKLPPGLVFMDPRDRVVDSFASSEIIKGHFRDWRIVPVQTLDLSDNHAFHMVIDEIHVGAEQWARMVSDIRDFLNR